MPFRQLEAVNEEQENPVFQTLTSSTCLLDGYPRSIAREAALGNGFREAAKRACFLGERKEQI